MGWFQMPSSRWREIATITNHQLPSPHPQPLASFSLFCKWERALQSEAVLLSADPGRPVSSGCRRHPALLAPTSGKVSKGPGYSLFSCVTDQDAAIASSCRGRPDAKRGPATPRPLHVTLAWRHTRKQPCSGAGSNEWGSGPGVRSAPSRGGGSRQWSPHRGGVLVSHSG